MEGNTAYLDFDLRFTRSDGGYRAEVHSPGGSGRHAFQLPFGEHELENYLLKIGQRRSGMRNVSTAEDRAAREFGKKLFDTVFQADLQSAFRKSIESARSSGNGLRIRLHLGETPELADLPWEYLYQPQRREFLALSTETPIVRYFDLPETVKPLAVTPPLRVLVMLSNPSDVDCLDVEKEWQKLKEAVRHLEESNRLIVERLKRATLGELQDRLRKGQYHVFHFVGHGSFDPATQESVLALENEDGRKRLVSGPDLGIYLRDEPALRLVLLNACEGARASRSDPFSGAAQSLVLKGIPAVIAMQFEVSDEAAIAMASGFYAALADDYPVDAALTEARKAVFAAGCAVEWGTPVLYLSAPDGCIFEIAKSAAPAVESAEKVTIIPPPPLPPVEPPPAVVRPKREPAPAVAHSGGRGAWPWIMAGMVLALAGLIATGMVINPLRRNQEKPFGGEFAAPSPAATAEPADNPKVAIDEPPAPTDSSRDEEFKAVKTQMEELSAMQQESSRVLDEMNRQARDAIRHIKPDESAEEPSFPSPAPGDFDGQLAGVAFQAKGWWNVATSPPYAVSRVLFNSNGRFSGTAVDVTGKTTALSGTWNYQPATSTLSVNYDNGAWARVVLVRKGRGFYSSFMQNYVTNEVYLEKEDPAVAPTAAPNKSNKY